LPGHGASGSFEHTPDTDSLCGWLDDLIECTSPVPPVLVGHTLGGALAAHFAGEQRGRLAALVLVDTLGLTPFQPTPAFGQALNEYLSAPGEASHDRLWSQCVFDLPATRTALGAQWASLKAYTLDRVQAPGGLAALSELMELYGVPAVPSATLARIAVPTTLIWGRQDRATALSVAKRASARFGWRLHVIDDAADDPALEQPEAFLSALRMTLKPVQMQEVSS
jgi:pimeloyl-ACP methyl ester carboxylesterase